MPSLAIMMIGVALAVLGRHLLAAVQDEQRHLLRTYCAGRHGRRMGPSFAGLVAGAFGLSLATAEREAAALAATGRLAMPEAMRIGIWADAGTMVILLVGASLPLFFPGLAALAVAGFWLLQPGALQQKLPTAVLRLLAAALLMIGLAVAESGAAGLPALSSWVPGSIHPALVVAMGFGVGLAFQDTALTGAVAVSLALSGLLVPVDLLLALGAAGLASLVPVGERDPKNGPGQRLARWLRTARLGLALLLLVAAFVLETTGAKISVPDLAGSAAAAVLGMATLIGLFTPLLARAQGPAAASRLDSLAEPVYLRPATPPDELARVIGREQARLVGMMASSLTALREDSDAPVAAELAAVPPQTLIVAEKLIGMEIDAVLMETLAATATEALVAPLRLARQRQAAIGRLGQAVGELALQPSGVASHLPAALVEGLHLLLDTLTQQIDAPDEFQQMALLTMTADRLGALDGLREQGAGGAFGDPFGAARQLDAYEAVLRAVQSLLATTVP